MVSCSQFFLRGFPILVWLPKYNLQNGICDLIAGITVGLTLIPQSIAYAALAGLGPEYGLYSSLFGGILYAIFGTVKDLNIAPTALVSLLTLSYVQHVSYGPGPAALLLCFLAGIVEIACGLLHLGFLVDFVSTPVVAGFTSAGALTIAASQVKNMLGIHFKAESFARIMYNVFVHIRDTRMNDAILSAVCCFCLISLREIKRFGVPPDFDKKTSTEKKQSHLKTALWFVSVARNALVVVTCAIMAYCLQLHDLAPFTLTRHVPSGLPTPQLPFLVNNGTVDYNIMSAVRELGTGIVIIPFVAILSNIAIAKSFADGKVLDASQEMLAMGICNLVGSFFGSYPVNASFSRAAVNNASGARTPFGGIYASILVILALTFLTPYFAYIPKATLSAVILCAVLYMVEVQLSLAVWKTNKIDFFPLIITLIACLALSIELGIIIGIVVDLLLVLYYTARPKIEMETIKNDDGHLDCLKVTFVGSLYYSAAEYSRDSIMKELTDRPGECECLVFDCTKLHRTDFTAIKCLESLVKDLHKRGMRTMFVGSKPSIEYMLRKCMPKKCYFVQTLEAFPEVKSSPDEVSANTNAAFEPDGMELQRVKL